MPGQSVRCPALGNSSSPRLCFTQADPTGSAGAGGTSRGHPSFHLQQCPHQRAGWLGPRAGLQPAGLGLSPLPPTCQLQNQTAHAVGAPMSAWGYLGSEMGTSLLSSTGIAHSSLSYDGHSQPSITQPLLQPADASPPEDSLPPMKTVQTQIMTFPNKTG